MALIQHLLGNAQFPGPLGDGHPAPVVFQEHIVSAVVVLSLGIRPSAVLWTVISVGVDSVYGQLVRIAVRYRPVMECLEIQPFIADSDSATSISGIALHMGIRASMNHRKPRRIDAGMT